MATELEMKNLAIDFVLDYIERDPEYLDVLEFVEDNYTGDLDTFNLEEEYGYVTSFLDLVTTYVRQECAAARGHE
jgi:hypothetical protein